MKAATLFSGIGAPELAMPNWQWLWHAEIEKFPSAVMASRHPESVNLGDVTAHDFIERAERVGRPDVIVFGSPCQSYSVAGKRLGLDDPRGNLALVALGIVARLKPTWFVFENVPGLFSSYSGGDEAQRQVSEGPVGGQAESDEDCDFAAFLAAVDELGFVGAWTVLDAQYFGVAQRRERVFFVGHSRDWRGPASVLFELESLCRHPPSRRQARQDVTGTLGSRSTGGGGLGTDFELAGGLDEPNQTVGCQTANSGGTDENDAQAGRLVAGTLGASHGNVRADQAWTGRLVPEVSPAMKARDYKGVSSDGDGDGDGLPLIVSHCLRGDGFDASEDGSGRGTPIVPATTGAICANSHPGSYTGQDAHTDMLIPTIGFNARQTPVSLLGRIGPLDTYGGTQAIAFAENQRGEVRTSDVVGNLVAQGGGKPGQGYPAIAFSAKDSGDDASVELSPTLRSGNHDASHANGGVMPAVALSVALRGREGGGSIELGGPKSNALRASQGAGDKPHVLAQAPISWTEEVTASVAIAGTVQRGGDGGRHEGVMEPTLGVRRLTPRECERLQGFPDDFTLVAYRGKPAADGPRYKAIGNSMAVPAIRWILERIERVDRMLGPIPK